MGVTQSSHVTLPITSDFWVISAVLSNLPADTYLKVDIEATLKIISFMSFSYKEAVENDV